MYVNNKNWDENSISHSQMLDSEFTSYSEHRVLTHQSVCFNSFMVFVSCLNAQNDGLEYEEE